MLLLVKMLSLEVEALELLSLLLAQSPKSKDNSKLLLDVLKSKSIDSSTSSPKPSSIQNQKPLKLPVKRFSIFLRFKNSLNKLNDIDILQLHESWNIYITELCSNSSSEKQMKTRYVLVSIENRISLFFIHTSK